MRKMFWVIIAILFSLGVAGCCKDGKSEFDRLKIGRQ
jgi:hypothetical protein